MTRSNLHFRQMVNSDFEGVCKLTRDSILSFSSETYGDKSALEWAEHQVETVPSLLAKGVYLVAEDADNNNELVACGGWWPHYAGESETPSGEIHNANANDNATTTVVVAAVVGARIRAVFVKPGCERRGIGKAIMEAIEKSAVEQGHRHFYLWSSKNAIPFYQACGYSQQECKQWKEGAVEIVCTVMTKQI